MEGNIEEKFKMQLNEEIKLALIRQWKSVDESLPNRMKPEDESSFSVDVLVLSPQRGYTVAFYDYSRKIWIEDIIGSKHDVISVSNWMEIPKM